MAKRLLYMRSTDLPTTDSQSYTAVNARTSLARPTMSPTSPPKSNAASKVEWPQPVREYVSRAFMADNLVTGIDSATMAAKLKQVISDAAESKMLDTIDWPNHPLPQEFIQMERMGASPVSSMASLSVRDKFASQSSVGQKRKSLELDGSIDANVPPWRQKGLSLAERIGGRDQTAGAGDHQGKRQKKDVEAFRATAPASKLFDLEKRKQRFERENAGSSSPFSTSRGESPLPSANDGPVVGTNQKLEKNYFRLTAPPKPETVRPLPVLRKTLDLLIQKWKDEHNYGYICDQFKSLRQDLTVQHVKNDFTVRVYEAHARIALEKGDLGEYNQCQTQLRALYKQKLGGRPEEFMAYRIFYFIHTCNRTGMNDVLADLTAAHKQHPAVRHALNVRSALATGNYHRFFRLYDDTPNMGGYLIDIFVERERLAAMASICRS